MRFIKFAIRILATIVCVNRAEDQGRSKVGWGLFGFFLPIIALITSFLVGSKKKTTYDI